MKKRAIYIQYTNPTAYPPLEHSSSILADDDWQIRFLGTKSLGASNALVFDNNSNISVRLMNYCHPGLAQKLHYLRYWLWCLVNSITFRPQIVYASDAWSYPVAYTVSFLPWLKVVMHEHDTPRNTGGRVNRLIGWFRKSLSRRAIACISPQIQRAETMQRELVPKNLQVVHNCPSREELIPLVDKSKDELRLWFHGSIVPTQLPIAVVEAMARCEFPVTLRFAGYETIGHQGYVAELLNKASQLGFADRVSYAGAIPTRKEMYAAAAENHVGLTLFAKQFREPMVGASNKPFDYLACGLALLVPDTEEWKAFFVESGCGIACDSEDVVAIANSLNWMWHHCKELDNFVKKGRHLLETRWNYQTQFAPIQNLLNAAAQR